MTYGNGKFVAVGYGFSGTNSAGVIAVSTNGIVWTDYSFPSTVWSVAYGNGLFVAGSDDGSFLTSSDGATWTVNSCCSSRAITALVYAEDKFVALGGEFHQGFDGVVLSSTDGKAWNCAARGTIPLRSLASSADRLVAVGEEVIMTPSAFRPCLEFIREQFSARKMAIPGIRVRTPH